MAKCALVADDDPVVQHILGAILEAESYQVKTLSSGKACLDYVTALLSTEDTAALDVIFLDVLLDDMSGIEVLTKLRACSKKLPPVIMLSANSHDEVFDGSELVSPDFFLEKPFVSETVVQALELVLGNTL